MRNAEFKAYLASRSGEQLLRKVSAWLEADGAFERFADGKERSEADATARAMLCLYNESVRGSRSKKLRNKIIRATKRELRAILDE